MDEEWRPIADFPHYLVSDQGRIRHADRMEARALQTNERGFVVILLSSQSSSARYLRQVNQLVATAFLEPTPYIEETFIWHIDGDLTNCAADNLRWESKSRVLEWNEMHRERAPKFTTPQVKNNKTGRIYSNAFECGMQEGLLESKVVWLVEKQASHMEDDESQYRYVFSGGA